MLYFTGIEIGEHKGNVHKRRVIPFADRGYPHL